MLDTLPNIKTRLGITTDDDDAFLTAQAELISDVIEAYCRRKFAEANWVQTFYKEDFLSTPMVLELYHFPLVSVAGLLIDTTSFLEADLRLHKPTAQLRRNDLVSFCGSKIVVQYRAGYSSIPTPVLAVLDALVSERYNKKKSGIELNFGSDIQRISIPGAISLDFDYSLANNDRKSSFGTIIGNHANVLDNYRSQRAVIGSGKIEYVEAGGP